MQEVLKSVEKGYVCIADKRLDRESLSSCTREYISHIALIVATVLSFLPLVFDRQTFFHTKIEIET